MEFKLDDDIGGEGAKEGAVGTGTLGCFAQKGKKIDQQH